MSVRVEELMMDAGTYVALPWSEGPPWERCMYYGDRYVVYEPVEPAYARFMWDGFPESLPWGSEAVKRRVLRARTIRWGKYGATLYAEEGDERVSAHLELLALASRLINFLHEVTRYVW